MEEQPELITPLLLQACKKSSQSPTVLYTSRYAEIRRGTETKRREFNLSYKVNDNPRIVDENRQLLYREIGMPVALVTQKHTNTVINIDDFIRTISDKNSHDLHYALEKLSDVTADAMVSSRRDIALAIFTADCTPVLFADSSRHIFAAAHSGRQGTQTAISAKTVHAMESLGACTDDIEVWIGPHICENCYETGSDIAYNFEEITGVKPSKTRFGGLGIDMGAAIFRQLIDAGIKSENIHRTDHGLHHQTDKGIHELNAQIIPEINGSNALCTLENPLLFSYREWTKTHRQGSNGRFLNIIIPN